MKYIYLLRKIFFTIIIFSPSFVYGQSCTISTKWPLCKCLEDITPDLQHNIITKKTDGYREFYTDMHGDNVDATFNFAIENANTGMELIFTNYPSAEFEPFICEYNSQNNWQGLQLVDLWESPSGNKAFVRTTTYKNDNKIHMTMPFSHRCRKSPVGFTELPLDHLYEPNANEIDESCNINKICISCKVKETSLEINISIPKTNKYFKVDLSNSPLIMHLNKEYFADEASRSISIKKTHKNKVLITFYTQNKQPGEIIKSTSKQLPVWNNESMSYELIPEDLSENSITFTHNLPKISFKKKVSKWFTRVREYIAQQGITFSYDENEFERSLLDQCSPLLKAVNTFPASKAVLAYVLSSCAGVTKGSETVINITNRKEFLDIEKRYLAIRKIHPNKKLIFNLKTDLDLSGAAPIGANSEALIKVDFSNAEFNGNNHKITKLSTAIFNAIAAEGEIHNLKIYDSVITDGVCRSLLTVDLLKKSYIHDMEFKNIKFLNTVLSTGPMAVGYHGGTIRNICIKNFKGHTNNRVALEVGGHYHALSALFAGCQMRSNSARVVENIHFCNIELKSTQQWCYSGLICGIELHLSMAKDVAGSGIARNIHNITVCQATFDASHANNYFNSVFCGRNIYRSSQGCPHYLQKMAQTRNTYIEGLNMCDVNILEGTNSSITTRTRFKSQNRCDTQNNWFCDNCKECSYTHPKNTTILTTSAPTTITTSAPTTKCPEPACPKCPEQCPSSTPCPEVTYDIQASAPANRSLHNEPILELNETTAAAGGIGAALACAAWTAYSYVKCYKDNYRGFSLLLAPITNAHRVLCKDQSNNKHIPHRSGNADNLQYTSVAHDATQYNDMTPLNNLEIDSEPLHGSNSSLFPMQTRAGSKHLLQTNATSDFADNQQPPP
ncbi:MAG: hypothetical protein QS748_01440 [Candidatus Endonucleobacter bathymodioli]|uniref:Uncharacterized protein n=1 Tax=Candidatus Endonucleibacter bathymodioli TaxID=539814 RepID=A0AA90SRT3_9GAMM|nr:hypothetical protein [Candidatus Endonucleobacter bathymodioli]